MNDQIDCIMTLKEFANYIRVHPNTVRKMIKSGILACFKSGNAKNSSYRIAKSESLRMSLVNLNEIMNEPMLQKTKKNSCSHFT